MPDVRPPDPRADRPPLRALPSPDVDTTDWPAQAADTIERAVQGVRDKTTGPAITVARWLVAGLFVVDHRHHRRDPPGHRPGAGARRLPAGVVFGETTCGRPT